MLIPFLVSFAHAQAAAGAAAQPSMLESMMPILIVLPVMYFFMIRPQAKKARAHAALVTGLKKGDQVLTESGIYGVVQGINEKFVTLEISEGVSIKVLKSKVSDTIQNSNQGEKK